MKLQSQNLTKKYSNKIAVQNLSINLIPGEILGLLGPNGAGKTTFFYMIAGLISSDSGKILIDGEDITNKSVSDRASMGLAYLPQEPSVFGRLSVEENIMAALEQRKDIKKEQRQQELEKLVEEFQLNKFLKTIDKNKLAIKLMEKLDNKYNMINVISLDEYVYEYYNVLTANEKTECFTIIEM